MLYYVFKNKWSSERAFFCCTLFSPQFLHQIQNFQDDNISLLQTISVWVKFYVFAGFPPSFVRNPVYLDLFILFCLSLCHIFKLNAESDFDHRTNRSYCDIKTCSLSPSCKFHRWKIKLRKFYDGIR